MSTAMSFPEKIYFVTTIRRNSIDGASLDRWYRSEAEYTANLVELGYLNEGESIRPEYYEPEEAVLSYEVEEGESPIACYRRADGREIIANEDGSISFPRINPEKDLDDDYHSAFIEGFEDAMPEDYCRREDEQADSPWCAPWCYENDTSWYSSSRSAYDAGRLWAENVLSDWEDFQADEGNRLTSEEKSTGNEICFPHVTVTLPSSRTAYFHWYEGQYNPQDAYLELDPENGTLIADWNGEIGNAVPFSVYNHRVFRWGFSATLPLQNVRDLMREIAPLAERICAGFDTDYDRQSNLVGVLNDDATEAENEIDFIMYDL